MTNRVNHAFLFALRVHGEQTRKDGKPYIVHPFSVATELAKNGADDALICAGLLHDTIEDGGVAPEELETLLTHAAQCGGLRVRGLMAIPPAVSAAEENRWYFRRMYELFVDIRRKTYDNVSMAELSMGMSGDYEEAVRCGATIVRLGTALFGPRNYDLQEAPPYGTIG